LIFLSLFGLSARTEDRAPVDLALVLAADCSGSVTAHGYRLQQQGYADAFRDPKVVKAILSGLHGGIAVTYFQWSGPALQNQMVTWTVLRSQADILAFADLLAKAPRTIYGGGTSVSGAIDFGRHLLGQVPVEAMRLVIDVSGDGRTNNGRPAPPARDEAVAAGITINGLPILNQEPDIDRYYQDEVIGGPGAFMIPARDFEAFGEAIRQKLILEIAALK
jgi:hypothetical protein